MAKKTATKSPATEVAEPPRKPNGTITVDRRAMLRSLGLLASMVPKTTPKASLKSVLIAIGPDGTGTISATNLEQSLQLRFQSVYDGPEIRFLVPHERLTKIISPMPDATVDILPEDAGSVAIGGGRVMHRIPVEPVESYPSIALMADEAANKGIRMSADAAIFRKAIRMTMPAADPDSTKFALGGCCITRHRDEGYFCLVALDGRQLSEYRFKAHIFGDKAWPEEAARVLPIAALKSIVAVMGEIGDADDATGEVSMTIGEFHSSFDFDGFGVLATRMVEGRFPRYQTIFPTEKPTSIVVPVKELAVTIAQIDHVPSDESRGVDFTFSRDSGLVLEANVASRGSARVEMPLLGFTSAEIGITFDPAYLTQTIKMADPESNVTIEVIDPKHAVVFRYGEDFSHVIMPLTRPK